MRRGKGSRRITVGGVEYRWRAAGDDGFVSIAVWPTNGDDGFVSIAVWPTNNVGPSIRGNLGYHETWVAKGDGSSSSAKDQIVVTSRIVRRVIELAAASFGYDPQVRGGELNLRVLDDVIEWGDAVRGGGRG